VATEVLKHVGDRVPRLLGAQEVLPVIAIDEERSLSPEQAIQAPGNTDAEALHAAAERPLVGSLGDQVKMISEHAEVDDAKLRAPDPRRADRSSDQWERLLRTKVTRVARRPKRDVNRMTSLVRVASAMSYPAPGSLSTGAISSAAPTFPLEGQLHLDLLDMTPSSSHLKLADILQKWWPRRIGRLSDLVLPGSGTG
jgi:hypothetical protein